jgi:dipeptidase E
MKLILASEFPQSFPIIASLLDDDLVGRKGVFIPTAAYGEAAHRAAAVGEGNDPDLSACSEPLESLGIAIHSFDLREKTEAQTEQALSDAAIIYVGGGNTFYLLEHMQKCNFEKVLRKRLSAGAIYIGSSAGSVICTPDIAYIHVMDDPRQASLRETKGLSLIDFLIIPHLDHPDQGERAVRGIETYQGNTALIALRDSQVLYVHNKVVQVF